ncbi:MAG: lipoprotein NlpI [Syntrophaceae bacterium PtaB.Bin038]|jgi:Flp pilus assembly protein TadD|nr:MAG: lipoprotein NlpI [Syntrophaceae bacterium PtaB.Bin038]
MIAKRWTSLAGILALVLAAAVLGGCASTETKDTAVRDEHRRMMSLQKNAEAARTSSAPLKDLPEMDARALEQVGDNYVRQNNPSLAFVQYDKALAKDPKLESARYKRGMLLLSRGMNDEALKEFEDILSRSPKNALALEGRGRVHMAKNHFHAAMADFDSALAADPKLWQVHALRGYLHDQRKEHDRAIGEYEKAIGLQPESSLLFNNLGMSRYLKGDLKGAAEAYARAIQLDVNNRRAYNNLALVLYKLGHDDDALLAFKHGGDEAAAYNNMGCLYMADRKYEKARAAFEKAIGLRATYFARAQENLKKAESAITARPTVQ